MTHAEILALTTGPELDAWIARLMGDDFGVEPTHRWKRDEYGEIDRFAMNSDYHNGPMCERCWASYCLHCNDKAPEVCTVFPRPYSTNIADAWRVVEKVGLFDDPDGVILSRRNGLWYVSQILPHGEWMQIVWEAASAPLAICLAALLQHATER